MTAEIPSNEPSLITAGDTVEWQRQDLTDYLPADGWALSYSLINSTGKITINAGTSGEGYLVSLSAAVTAAYTAGVYSWQAYATNSGDSKRVVVDSGTMEIAPNFSAMANYDSRSHAKKVLDAIEAVIEGRASVDQESYAIMGRQLKRTPMADLLKLRDRYSALYLAEVNAENAKTGKGKKNKLKVRF